MKKQNANYLVHGFMRDFDIGGITLLIYAALYSFSVGGDGFYYGGQKYLAEMTGVTTRTVQNQLSKLFEMGLIERVEKDNRSGIRCRVLSAEEKGTAEPPAEKEETPGEDLEDGELYDGDDEPLPDDEDFREGVKIMRKAHRTVTPKNKFYQFDKDGWVFMTEEQYFALAAIADADTISQYVARLSRLIEKEDYNPHNHYKTLREWILKDTGV